jgi:hypothetical protein
MLPANSTGIRVQTAFGGYRVDPDELALTVDNRDGSASDVDIVVNESEPGVYDVVPESGFEPMSTYTLSSANACGASTRDQISFGTAEAQALPAFDGQRLQVVVSSGDFSHFDTVACTALAEPSRTAVITAPDVDAPWKAIVLYRWTVNGIHWVERSGEREVQFSQSCESGWGSALWSGGQGSRFWMAPELSVTLELRLPGASNVLWADSRVISIDCAETETGSSDGEPESANTWEGPPASVSQVSADAPLVQSEKNGATGNAANAAGCSMSEPTCSSSIWALLICGLPVIVRRRRREMAN